MSQSKPIHTYKRKQAFWLSITGGLAILTVTLLYFASAGQIPVMASPPQVRDDTTLGNGSVITIGVAAALTPLNVEWLGWPQANAVQLAVSQTNAAGGINIGGTAYTVNLVTVDSGCNSTQGEEAANFLLDAGVVAVIGHSCSGASLAAQPIYNAAGVAMVSPSASFVGLTDQGYNTTFRVSQRDDAEAVLIATYFRLSLGMDSVALVERSATGYEYAPEAFYNTFTSLGGTITSRRTVTSTDDYTATLTVIQGENPDAVFYAEDDPGAAGLFSSIAEAKGLHIVGWDAVWQDENALPGYGSAAGPGAEGDYAGLNGRRTQDMPGYAAFNADYQAAGFPNYGGEADVWGAFAFDAAQIIIAAIDRADSTNPADIRDQIAATADYDGVVGPYAGFDANGDVIPQWAWMTWFLNGDWGDIFPYKVFLPFVINSTP